MKKKLLSFLPLIALTALLILPYLVFAQDTDPTTALGRLEAVAIGGGYEQQGLSVVMGTVIRAALSLLGGVFIILIVIGGYDWMTAEGNEQKVEKAQNYIRRAIIGLVITLSAWAIWFFLLEKFILGL